MTMSEPERPGDLLRRDLVPAETVADEIREAEARTWRQAVEALRDDARYLKWWAEVQHPRNEDDRRRGRPSRGSWFSGSSRGNLADYLESLAPSLLPAPPEAGSNQTVEVAPRALLATLMAAVDDLRAVANRVDEATMEAALARPVQAGGSEQERRELAERHRDQVVPGSGRPITPRRLGPPPPDRS
jgi:hypothetical protein